MFYAVLLEVGLVMVLQQHSLMWDQNQAGKHYWDIALYNMNEVF